MGSKENSQKKNGVLLGALDKVYLTNWNGKHAITPEVLALCHEPLASPGLALAVYLGEALTLPQQTGEYKH